MLNKRADLYRLLTAIKEAGNAIRNAIASTNTHVEAIAKNIKASDESAEQQPATQPSRIAVDIQIPREETDRYYAGQKKANSLQWWTLWATIATFLAVAIYALLTFLQWRTTQMSANAARSAAEVARSTLAKSIEQFRIDERAWIEIEPIKPILFMPRDNKFGAKFVYELYPKNVGKTVARDIILRAAYPASGFSLGDDAAQIGRAQESLLHEYFGDNNRMPKVLAPGTISAVPFRANGQEPIIFNKGAWYSFLIGRIDYTDAFLTKHWMKFCFIVVNSRGELWNCHEGNDEDRNPEIP